MINGDLFKGVMAFSPGFIIDGPWVGKPSFYISHGKQDPILPIEGYRRQVYGRLIGRAYSVIGTEFDGGHEMPDKVVREGFAWMRSL